MFSSRDVVVFSPTLLLELRGSIRLPALQMSHAVPPVDSLQRHSCSLCPLTLQDRLLANLFQVGSISFDESTKWNNLAADLLMPAPGRTTVRAQ